MKKFIRYIFVVVASIFLFACGGGGGADVGTTPVSVGGTPNAGFGWVGEHDLNAGSRYQTLVFMGPGGQVCLYENTNNLSNPDTNNANLWMTCGGINSLSNRVNVFNRPGGFLRTFKVERDSNTGECFALIGLSSKSYGSDSYYPTFMHSPDCKSGWRVVVDKIFLGQWGHNDLIYQQEYATLNVGEPWKNRFTALSDLFSSTTLALIYSNDGKVWYEHRDSNNRLVDYAPLDQAGTKFAFCSRAKTPFGIHAACGVWDGVSRTTRVAHMFSCDGRPGNWYTVESNSPIHVNEKGANLSYDPWSGKLYASSGSVLFSWQARQMPCTKT